jgi:hypothetical protein
MKIKSIPYILLLLILGTYLTSCDQIIEPSINKSTVQLETPADKYMSPTYTINFWWDAVNNALTYHLQVVTPSFASPGSLVLDTVVTSNKFSFNMSPGIYQWRIMAQNGSSQTAYTTPRTFTVQTASLTQQQVQLSSPANDFLTNKSSATLAWGTLYGATQYQIEIDTNNFVNESAVITNQTFSANQFVFNFPKDQTYQWRVKAKNDSVSSEWSAVNTITFDNVPPPAVIVSAPANNLIISAPVTLQWNASTSATNYKLYVFQSDSVTTYNSTFPMLLSATSYNFILGSSGDRVYWKVTALDAAGNESLPSALRSFVLQ